MEASPPRGTGVITTFPSVDVRSEFKAGKRRCVLDLALISGFVDL
jgi:hypothetical protein